MNSRLIFIPMLGQVALTFIMMLFMAYKRFSAGLDRKSTRLNSSH